MAFSDEDSPGLKFDRSIKHTTRKKHRLITDSDDENSSPCMGNSTQAYLQPQDQRNFTIHSTPLGQLNACIQQRDLGPYDEAKAYTPLTSCAKVDNNSSAVCTEALTPAGGQRMPAADSPARPNDMLCTPCTPQSAVALNLRDPFTPWLRTTGKPQRAWAADSSGQLTYGEQVSPLSFSSSSSISGAYRFEDDVAEAVLGISSGQRDSSNPSDFAMSSEAALAAVNIDTRQAEAAAADTQVCNTSLAFTAVKYSKGSTAASASSEAAVHASADQDIDWRDSDGGGLDVSGANGEEPSAITSAGDEAARLVPYLVNVNSIGTGNGLPRDEAALISNISDCGMVKSSKHQHKMLVDKGSIPMSGTAQWDDHKVACASIAGLASAGAAADVSDDSIGIDDFSYAEGADRLPGRHLQTACTAEVQADHSSMQTDHENHEANCRATGVSSKHIVTELAAVKANVQTPQSATTASAGAVTESSWEADQLQEVAVDCFRTAEFTTPTEPLCRTNSPATPFGSVSMYQRSAVNLHHSGNFSQPPPLVDCQQPTAAPSTSNSSSDDDDDGEADVPLTFSRRKPMRPAWRTQNAADHDSSDASSEIAEDKSDESESSSSSEFSFEVLQGLQSGSSRRSSHHKEVRSYSGRVTPGSSSSLVSRRRKEQQQLQRGDCMSHTPLHQQQQQPLGLWWEDSGGKASTGNTAVAAAADPYDFDSFMPVSTPPASFSHCLMTPGAILHAGSSGAITQLTPATTTPPAAATLSPVQQFNCAAIVPPPATAAVGKGRRKQQTPAGNMTAPAKAAQSSRQFARQRQQVAQQLYDKWNAQVFDGGLPPQLPLVWNPRLTSTAGQVVDDGSQNRLKTSREERIPVRLELSTKVLDTEARLRTTLGHEMCHVAAWAISHEYKQHHGPAFWSWARRFEERVPGIKISTCHNYEIHAPFRWQCMNLECGKQYHRHKRSIDPNKHVCSRCNGRLAYLGKFSRDGKLLGSKAEQTPGAANGTPGGNIFSNFVRNHFASVRKDMPAGTPHKEIMSRLAAEYKLQKAAAVEQVASQETQQQQEQQQTAPEPTDSATVLQDTIELLSDDDSPRRVQQVAEEGLITFLDRLDLAG